MQGGEGLEVGHGNQYISWLAKEEYWGFKEFNIVLAMAG